jgi:hypothetical protein
MSKLRTIAFVAGGAGLVLFLAGIAASLVAGGGRCASVGCDEKAQDQHGTLVVLLWSVGLALVIAGAGLLIKFNADQKRRPSKPTAARAPGPGGARPMSPAPPAGQARLPPRPPQAPDVRSGPLRPPAKPPQR